MKRDNIFYDEIQKDIDTINKILNKYYHNMQIATKIHLPLTNNLLIEAENEYNDKYKKNF